MWARKMWARQNLRSVSVVFFLAHANGEACGVTRMWNWLEGWERDMRDRGHITGSWYINNCYYNEQLVSYDWEPVQIDVGHYG